MQSNTSNPGVPQSQDLNHSFISFPNSDLTNVPLTKVGGKAFALLELSNAGFPVPPGIALTANFFEPWIVLLQNSDEWRSIISGVDTERDAACEKLKIKALKYPLNDQQQETLRILKEKLRAEFSGRSFAVRSSAPEEDGESTSFAGVYLSELSVSIDKIEEAIRACFISSLDARVFAYKEQQGLDSWQYAFATVIQTQIDSEAAGVAFSLNPVTNDYDEVLINSNWGLGESVVAGEVSPDQFIVDKVERKVIDKQLGDKSLSYFSSMKRVETKTHYRSEEYSLTAQQILAVSDLAARVENHYKKPMDIEWAISQGKVYLLQARPITIYVPLPEELQTQPGERRRLYSDVMLSNGYTMNSPCSPLEMSCAQDMFGPALEPLVGKNPPPDNALILAAGGRVYSNMSPILRWVSPKSLAKSNKGTEVLLSKIFAGIDRKRYRSLVRPPWLGLHAIKFLIKWIWRYKGIFLLTPLGLILGSQEKYRKYLAQTQEIKTRIKSDQDYSQSLREFRRHVVDIAIKGLFGPTGVLLMAAIMAQGLVMKIAGKAPRRRAMAEKIQHGLPDNVVVQMGILMHRAASHLPVSEFDNIEALADKISTRQMPAEFLCVWDEFIDKFGCRGPNEMDCASPRYGDDIELALRQMAAMAGTDSRSDPELVLKRQIEERRATYQSLMQELGWLRRRLLRRCANVIDAFAGIRDTPKYHVVLGIYAFKKRALMEGKKLVSEGRLDSAEQIFGLSLEDVETAQNNPDLDLRLCYQQRMQFYRQLQRQVKVFPSVIDSRGRILRPVLDKVEPGTLRGSGFSPGVARGPVKVLTQPDEKPVNKGDILVAYTTDPGWTPLFINAAAIVLEIGGVLQHGVVVAREYGLPCVAGVNQIAEKFVDGQLVEVDGDTGIIRFLE